jgi:hypothetical protein
MEFDVYTAIMSQTGVDIEDEIKMTVANIAKEVSEFNYEYDFGDRWAHTIVIEKSITIADEIEFHPICVGGENNCPLEDSRGIKGYENEIEVLNNPNHPEYKKINSWILKMMTLYSDWSKDWKGEMTTYPKKKGKRGKVFDRKVFDPKLFDLLHVNAYFEVSAFPLGIIDFFEK